jgi:predicted RNA-binding Zn-ribbon protein involved in translation (DUF1610 family)
MGALIVDDLEAEPYMVHVFDCPACGGQTMLGDADLNDTEECSDCNATVVMVK